MVVKLHSWGLDLGACRFRGPMQDREEEKALHWGVRRPMLIPEGSRGPALTPGARADSKGGLAMRTAERHHGLGEAHFTEGELDLEPPEELAIGELDEETILEEELDNEDLLEEDVDEDTLQVTLEDLVHGGDDVDDAPDAERPIVPGTGRAPGSAGSDGPEDSDEGFDTDTEDVEESLDLVLLERMALLGQDGDLYEEDGSALVEHNLIVQMQSDSVEVVHVAPCGSDEFVCPSCFLVRKRVQLTDPVTMACHDCST
jgi:hypothetical protein